MSNILRKYINLLTESTGDTNSMGRTIHPTPEGIVNFWKWAGNDVLLDEQHRPQVFFHGTSQDIPQFSRGIAWFSKMPNLANEYTDYRMAMDMSAPGSVLPVYLKSAKQFDADVLPRSCKITQFFTALLKQSGIDPAKLKPYMDIVRDGAQTEESGPYYSVHDFWYLTSTYFGGDGYVAIMDAFKICGFDAIKYTEREHETIGILNPTHIKSAIGNSGNFSRSNPVITEANIAQTATPEFAQWFGNSKIVDKSGNPLIVYHGTTADVSQFEPAKSGSKSKTGAPPGTFFFTDAPDIASSYTVKRHDDFSTELHDTANVMQVYLKITKPLKINARGDNWRYIPYKNEFIDINEVAQIAKNSGRYDGVIVTNVLDKGVGRVTSKKATTYIAFSPTQIKSAIGNDGSFDGDDPNINS